MGRHVVITGTNRGIGLELTKRFLANGDAVTALCREPSDELKKTDATIISEADVSDFSSLQKAASKVEGKVDILINNAGIMKDEKLENFGDQAFKSMQDQFRVNTLGPLKTFTAMRDKFNAGAKVAMITSRMGSIADNTSGGRYGYRMSKTALNMAAASLAHDLRNQEVSVGIYHPGFVKTDMTGNNGNLTPAQAAENLFHRIQELNLERSGRFFHSNGEELPW